MTYLAYSITIKFINIEENLPFNLFLFLYHIVFLISGWQSKYFYKVLVSASLACLDLNLKNNIVI